MNLADFLTETAKRAPDLAAIRFNGEEMSYLEMDRRVDALARGLRGLGLRPGDKCVLMMPNCINWVLAYYALARMGAVVVPVNFIYRRGELQHIFSDSGARAFIGHRDHLAEAMPVIESLPEMGILVAEGEDAPAGFTPLPELFDHSRDSVPYAATAAGDPFAIIYTSGTTGLPKGAVLTHGNLMSDVLSVSGLRSSEPGDVVISALPLFHIYGQTHALNLTIYSGLTLRMWDHFDPAEVMAAIEEEESTILYAVPTMINRLVELGSAKPPRRSSLRFCVSGGASLPVEVFKRFESIFDTWIMEGYGLTECSPTCLENPPGRTRTGSIGFPIPGFRARVVDENDVDVPRGEVGELVIAGPGVMKEYLNQPEATAVTLKGGWLHTGDLALQDEDGYFFIVDRKKELIIRGGYNVYPREVEEVFYQHPAVLEVAVLGIPHADLGEEVAAAVVLRPGAVAQAEELRDFVKERIAPYKYPRVIEFVGELPRNSAGKVLKREISLGG
ncbi:MAG: long-chain fatty acid--CoA ligase [Actinomycetota bacterium]|nr:long-chain fatty acid--CoA ligase [Actinomycetota bacterium]MDD5667056.1 long-chain fatty acid--CoA ligase [Actinomycetota bacterium]